MKSLITFFAVTFISTTVNAGTNAIVFSLASLDNKATLGGTVDLPPRGTPLRATLFIAQGQGGNREVYDSPDDNLPTPTAAMRMNGIVPMLNTLGIATVRYDTRGMQSATACLSRLGIPVNAKNYVKHCTDFNVRRTVTAKALRDDLIVVFKHAIALKELRTKPYGFFGLSEGFLIASDVISAHQLNPRLFAGIGAPIASGLDHAEYQSGQFLADWLRQKVVVNGGYVSNEYIKSAYEVELKNRLSHVSVVLSNTGGWDEAKIKEYEKPIAENTLKEAQKWEAKAADETIPGIMPPDVPVPVIATVDWYRETWTRRTQSPLNPYQLKICVPILLFYGESDTRTPLALQQRRLTEAQMDGLSVTVNTFEKLEHGLTTPGTRLVPEDVAATVSRKISGAFGGKPHRCK